MFNTIRIWLRSLFGRKVPVKPRLDEFHTATYEELFNAAWTIVAGTPPVESAQERKSYLTTLQSEWPTKGARIEFNREGLGRVVATRDFGLIDVVMANLPCKVRWDPSRMCLKPSEAESRQFFVRLMDGSVPGVAGGKESTG